MQSTRRAGILLHPSSLPGDFGIGDFGREAENFLHWCKAAGQSLWQILPLGPTGLGNSPYGALSSFAGNPLLISPELLLHERWLTPEDLAGNPHSDIRHVDFGAVTTFKESLLRKSFERFRQTAEKSQRKELAAFSQSHRAWLDDWATYAALKGRFGGREWSSWDLGLARRDGVALAAARKQLHTEIAYHSFVQWIFFHQWTRLRRFAHDLGISILGDLPIYVAYDSADVWANQHLFVLDENRKPLVVSGVPPDYFSKTGQRWGNPIYRWDVMAKDGFEWWIHRLRGNLALVDELRLDHFRGFSGYWEIPADEETAVNGRWVPGPGERFFSAVRNAFGELPLVAEDLGTITPDVEVLRESFNLPGMRVLQFAFGEVDSNHLPHHYTRRTIVYTGTHDNNTSVGWMHVTTEDERRRIVQYCGETSGGIAWTLIRTAYASVADTAIVPFQDVCALGSDARMNTPGEGHNNWSWRARHEQFRSDTPQRLHHLAELTGRTK